MLEENVSQSSVYLSYYHTRLTKVVNEPGKSMLGLGRLEFWIFASLIVRRIAGRRKNDDSVTMC